MFELKLNKPQANKPQPVKKINKLFEGAMDDTPAQETAKPKMGQYFAEMSQKSYEKMLDDTSKLVMEDPTIYAYDAHYDQIQEKRQEIEEKKQQRSGPKHIQNIMNTVEKRKLEQTMIYEKIEGRKLQREGEQAGGQVYVTKSYKQKMEEGRKFLEEDAAKEAANKERGENQDNLYKNLYKQDIFMGGYRPDLNDMIKQDKNPAPKPTEPVSQQQAQKPQEAPQKPREEIRVQPRDQKVTETTAKGETSPERRERAAVRRGESRSRSRSRSKSPIRENALREEAKVQKQDEPEKEKEKELTKEEKMKLARERFLQRKMGQSVGPTNPEQA